MSIKDNLIKIKENLPVGVGLVAVSKFHSAQEVIEAIQAGQKVFGENRVQEAAAKFDEVKKSYPDICLRIIGQLQRNKVKEAVRVADAIDSVDRLNCLTRLKSRPRKSTKRLRFCLSIIQARSQSQALKTRL